MKKTAIQSWCPGGDIVGRHLPDLCPKSTLYPALAKVLAGEEASIVVQWVPDEHSDQLYRCSVRWGDCLCFRLR